MRTQLRNFFRYRHNLAPIGLFLVPEARANLAVLPGKPMNIRYLYDAKFLLSLTSTWDCLFRRQAQPGNHFLSQLQLGNEWTFNIFCCLGHLSVGASISD